MAATRPYSPAEEFCNALIHGIGVALAAAMTAVLAVFAGLGGDPWTVVSVSVFGASMIVMYAASTLYHTVASPSVKQGLRKFDHIAIYYLIAGTYTPFLLVSLRGPLGWSLLAVVWAMAAGGTVLQLRADISARWSVALYLAMGWLIVFASGRLFQAIPPHASAFIVAGGLAYTAGCAFYVMKSRRYAHAVWHLFVLAGTLLHFFAVLFGVVLA
ncbi:hemolysin III [Alphaproteobacteria bacterium]|nr:hemolysin III [Alphaproteobacteria bacterium]